MVQPLSSRGSSSPLPSTEGQRLHRLGGLLARWHLWRKVYTPERGYARIVAGERDPEDALEHMLMATVEQEVGALPQGWQRMLQQVARAECMGIEMDDTTSCHYAAVLNHLAHRLRSAGVL